MMDSPVMRIIRDGKIIIVLGPGGVGKTTNSVCLAMQGARAGKRVALLSIDPAKRLADAMGIRLGHELSKVHLPDDISGEVHACMLDQAAVFDHMVRKFASEKVANKIFQNSVYRQASRNLGGPIEYMALAKLTELISAQYFDLIVLDTPPDTHALDFLVRPSNLAGFVEKGVMKWLIKPFHLAQRLGFGKLFSVGEKLMGGVAAVTGIKMLEKLSEFLVLMDDVIVGFHQSGIVVTAALREASTKFVLVTAPHSAPCRASQKIADELAAKGFRLELMIINRLLPESVRQAMASHGANIPADDSLAQGLWQQFRSSEEIMARLTMFAQQRWQEAVEIIKISEQNNLDQDVTAVMAFSDLLAQQAATQ